MGLSVNGVVVIAALAGCAATIGGAAMAATWINVVRSGRVGLPDGADAIVVFGARASPGGPSPELRARLSHAAALYRDGRAPTVLCSGGFDRSVSEARVMAATLSRLGIPPSSIAIDEGGCTTRGTLTAVRRRRVPSGWSRIIGVSSPYHLHRIAKEARRHGLECMPSAGSSTPITRNTRRRRRQIAREVLAIWWYALSWRADRFRSLIAPSG